MNTLFIHSDKLVYETKKKTKLAEQISDDLKRKEIGQCLVAFMSFETADEGKEENVAEEFSQELMKVANELNEKTIVLYPFVHILFGKKPSSPETALKIMKLAEEKLKKENFTVYKSPFGWYKAFEIHAKGHPLSELSREITGEGNVKRMKPKEAELFTIKDNKLSKEDKLNMTCSFVLAKSVKELYPKVKVGLIGLQDDQAFFDFYGMNFKKEDLEKIESRMNDLFKQNLSIEKKKVSNEKATELLRGEDFELEILRDLDLKEITLYELDGLSVLSLEKDPFLNAVKDVKQFKLLNLSGAYWRNDSSNKMMNRIYCKGFASEDDLSDYLKMREEAEERSHIKLGKELGLYSIHDEAPGMPFFHNKGTIIFNKLVEHMTEEMLKLGYEINKTPIILNQSLWERSGHWNHYKDNMYFTKIDGRDFAVKPMNCPGNLLIYKSNQHSYKELPIKAGEFGLVHRHELSGVLSGLFRVRAFTQDDAHIFCMEEQLQRQITELMDLVNRVYSTFGFDYHVELSTKPDNAMGSPDTWELAEKILEDSLKKKKVNYKINAGDGAFYGPKIDFHVKDSLGRSWQCGTIQLDFSMPEKFDLVYEGSDGKNHRPVMLHRAIYGSVERFMGILIEHFAGKFPLWMSPVQVKIITVTDRSNSFAEDVLQKLKKNKIRAELNSDPETLNKKVREAQNEKVNYIVTIGDKEVASNCLAIRHREGEVKFGVKIDDFMAELLEEINDKRIK